MRHIPVMLALLLALSPGAVAFQAAAPSASVAAESPSDASVAESPSDVPSAAQSDADQPASTAPNENTTNVMTLGTEPTRSAYDSPALALGNSLAMDYDESRTDLAVETLDQRLSTAETDERRKQILNRYRYQIENRIISLKAEERRVTNEFSNGTMSEREYLTTLGHIDAEAGEIRTLVDAIESRSEDVSRFDLQTDVSMLNGNLVSLEGPVRDRIGRTVRGETSPLRVYVSTSDSGIVLSAIFGDVFVREAVRLDHRNQDTSSKLSLIEAQNVVLDRYSWASQNMDSDGTNTYGFGSTNVYFVSVSHQHGDVVAYVDGGTQQVFNEIQHKQLFGENSLPPGPTVNESAENLTLGVSRTYSGGPLRVKLTNATGEPVQGDISIDGEPIGRTTQNGVLWTLGPTEEFRVSATYDGRTVNVTTTPMDASPATGVTTEQFDSP